MRSGGMNPMTLLLLLTMESVYMPHIIYGMTWLGIDIPSQNSQTVSTQEDGDISHINRHCK